MDIKALNAYSSAFVAGILTVSIMKLRSDCFNNSLVNETIVLKSVIRNQIRACKGFKILRLGGWTWTVEEN